MKAMKRGDELVPVTTPRSILYEVLSGADVLSVAGVAASIAIILSASTSEGTLSRLLKPAEISIAFVTAGVPDSRYVSPWSGHGRTSVASPVSPLALATASNGSAGALEEAWRLRLTPQVVMMQSSNSAIILVPLCSLL